MRHLNRLNQLAIVICGTFAFTMAVVLMGIASAQQPVPPKDAPSKVALEMRDIGDLSVAFRNLTRQAFPSIVSIDVTGRPTKRRGLSMSNRRTGSGFVLDPAGFILTNSQLVSGAERVRIRFSDGSTVFASGIRIDPRSNVAVVEVPAIANLPGLALGDSGALRVGDWVLGVGQSSQRTPSAAEGIINSIVPGPGVSRADDFFQTDVTSNPGGDGGPLLNLKGQVIGISSSNSNEDELSDHGRLVVPSNLVKWVSQQLIEKGTVTRSYLGVETKTGQGNTPPNAGALVNRVLPNTPAAKAMLKTGDIITKVGGLPVSDARHLMRISERLLLGRTYSIEINRSGESSKLDIIPVRMPDKLNLSPKPMRLDVLPPDKQPVNEIQKGGL